VLYGNIGDKNTGEILIGASLSIVDLNQGTVTDDKGEYSLSLPKGKHTIIVSSTGYKTDTLNINISQDTRRNIRLSAISTILSSVEISAEQNQNIRRIEPSVNRLSATAIKAIPAMMGEVDIVKALQLLPGVQAVAEGSSNFSVRGGGYDQNLILLDDATIYGASHLLGFFSIFNNDAIKDVKLYKGDIPVAFGGRLSSLMEVRTKDNITKKLRVNGSIGTISSKLTIETPIVDEKVSLMLSGRRTYADIFIPLANDKSIKNAKLYFYDLNGKFNWTISRNDRVFLSVYSGKDHFKNQLAGISFSNNVGSAGWHHVFSPRLVSNLSVFTSKYDYFLLEDISEEISFDWKSVLNDIGGKLDFTWLPDSNNSIRFGYQAVHHRIDPGKGGGSGQNTLIDNSSFQLSPMYTLEHALYASHQTTLFDKLGIRYGLRLSMMNNLGNDSITYNIRNYAVVDSFFTKKGQIYNTNLRLEPRISLNYSLGRHNSIKASFSHSAQYIQLASNSTAGSPLSIWFSASNNVRPQLCNQFVLGYFHDFFDGTLETSAEVYYKHYTNVIDFKDRARLLGNKDLERELRFGTGYSYGFELMIAKPSGRINGWVSYTFARSFRQIDEVNGGERYRSPYDKPHNISVVVNYELSRRWTLSATWVYSTGQPVTYPEGRYWVGDIGSTDGKWVIIPSKRNAYRFPDFHRLDLSATWKLSQPHKRFQHELNISVYNAYARKNPWTIYFVKDKDNPNKLQGKMMYLFSIVPSVSWNFHF